MNSRRRLGFSPELPAVLAAPALLVGEPEPVEVHGDSAYGSGGFRQHLAERGHTATIKPIPLNPPSLAGSASMPDGRTLYRLARAPRQSQVRYRGIARNQIGFTHRCAAVNLRRLVNLGIGWDNGWMITT